MSAELAAVAPLEPTPIVVPADGQSWGELLRELVAPILINDCIDVLLDDVVGGGPCCAIAKCPRPADRSDLCSVHDQRWRLAGQPDRSHWDAGEPLAPEHLSLAVLPTPLRWEVAYGILQARQKRPQVHMRCRALHNMIADLADAKIGSLLEPEEGRWPSPRRRARRKQVVKLRLEFLIFTIDELDLLRGLHSREHEFTQDVWRGRRIGFPGTATGWLLDLRHITHPWLREATKKFLRWRVDVGHSPSGVHRDLRVLTQLSQALTDVAGPTAQPGDFDRTVITRLLTRLAEEGFTANGRNQRMSSLKKFLIIGRQHDWLPGVPVRTAVYSEDFPARPALAPRALSSFVMAQLEDADNLDKLTDRRWRLLFPLLTETGLRIGDALHLPLNCVVHDHQQAPYLRYYNRKMKREALVPISTETASSIADQARWVRERYSARGLLFPSERHNPDGGRPTSDYAVRRALDKWIAECPITDESGALARITPHQFRHTLGTRLINNDVPQEVVRRILDHSSLAMTAHYARLHDSTVRRHWERARKIDIHGNDVATAGDGPLADAQWVKHHLSRASQALPNGYCGMPLQQSCPHANACLTCPVFITTAEFLPQHREQLEMTRGIIERAHQRGQLRLVEMNQRTADNLITIIDSLETPTPTTECGGCDAC